MVYSCAYFRGDTDKFTPSMNALLEAQENKFKLLGQKLHLEPGMQVLDIGCGWGGLAHYLSKEVQVDAITNSVQQYEYAKKTFPTDRIHFHLCDYREFKSGKQYDRIVSVGMFEHVCPKQYRQFMEIVYNLLKPNGIFVLHTIGQNKSQSQSDPWITKYIFPNSFVPSLAQISTSSEGLFVIEDLHNLGINYDKTLLCWYHNLKQYPLSDKVNDRKWQYYLLLCAGYFRARQFQLYQIVLTKSRYELYSRPLF